MKLLYLMAMPLLILVSCVLIWAASEEEEQTVARGTSLRLQKEPQKQVPEHQGARIISFDAVDRDINLGLNYLMPFVQVPMKRKRNAPPKPLVIVNSAAIFSCGLVVAGGLLAGHIVRSLGLETILPADKPSENIVKPASSRALHNEEQSILQLLDNFKLIYRNESGERVETRLPTLIGNIETTLLENDINLPICLLKSICALIHRAHQNVRIGQATDLEQLLDGATSWSWLLSWLQQQSAVREAIEAARSTLPNYCAAKYDRCKWTAPDEQILELFQKNVQFT